MKKEFLERKYKLHSILSKVNSIGKEAFYKQSELNLFDAYEYTSRVMTEHTLNENAKEGIDAFLEKRDPNWRDM